MKRLLFYLSVAFLWGCSSVTEGNRDVGLVINEIMVRNSDNTGIVAPNGKAEDWIELYNFSDDTIDLSNYFLTDSIEVPIKANLPTLRLAPKAYITLWCGNSANTGDLFLGFTLNKDSESGDVVYLFDKSIELIDSCHFLQSDKATKKGVSYGRLPDGGTTWHVQIKPTPSGPNNE